MKKRTSIKYIFLLLLLSACYTDDFFEVNKDAYYKLYGNGTYQEAVDMAFTQEGEVYIAGNQFVRNQDSSAVLLIRADVSGNQLWSKKYFGLGYSVAKTIQPLSSSQFLVLASTREQDKSISNPLIYRIDEKGELLNEYFIEQEEGQGSSVLSMVPEDMVPGGNGDLVVVGNMRGVNGVSEQSFLIRIDLETGKVLDRRYFSNSDITEAKQVFRVADHFFVFGNTRLEVGEMKSQNMFIAAFSDHLLEEGQVLVGGPRDDTFKKAIVSSRNEFVLSSTEQIISSTATRGVLHFIDPLNFAVRGTSVMNYSVNEVPEAIEEDADGNFYIAVNSIGDRGNSDIVLNKIKSLGEAVWDSPKVVGGEGNDRIAQVRIMDDFVYLLKTVDMQNENTLISLSKIKF